MLELIAATVFACHVVSVWDGDTFTCHDGTKVRVHGIAAPELREPQGPASGAYMRALVLGLDLSCADTGRRSYGRVEATCYLPPPHADVDVAALAVAAGQARDCPRYSRFGYLKDEGPAARLLPLPDYCLPRTRKKRSGS